MILILEVLLISRQFVSQLSDAKVLLETKRLATREQAATADLVALLAELDTRKLYFTAGFNSLFAYCLDELHLSEDAAYTRIEVARISRVFPLVLELVSDGSLSLTNARLLIPVLTSENHKELLRAARHQRKKSVELMVARVRPKPDVAPAVRKLASPAGASTSPLPWANGESVAAGVAATSPTLAAPPMTPATRPIVAPLAPERFKVQFTADQETHDLLRRAQALLRHRLPMGDLPSVFKLALTCLVSDLERKKAAVVARPRRSKRAASPGSRHIAAEVRRAVWRRTGRSVCSKDQEAAVQNVTFSSSIMSARLLRGVRPPSTTSSCAAARTTRTRWR